MRRAYGQTLKRLAEPSKLWPLILKALSARIRPGLAPPLASPILATLELTHQCNLSCRFCPVKKSGTVAPPPDWMPLFIREVAQAGILGLGFTGGEPLLLDNFEKLATLATGEGLITHLNTNGTLITPGRAARLMETGLASINISLDGARPATHDFFRGKDTHGRTLAGIEALVRARENRPVQLLLAMVLCEENAEETFELIALARKLGMDGCTFLPLTRFHSRQPLKRSPKAAKAAATLAREAGDPAIDNSARYLLGMARYFLGSPMPGRCSALHSSILASPDGYLYPCVPSGARGHRGIAYVPGTLMDHFRSGALAGALDEFLCRGCWWNCHRELDLTLGVL